MPMTPKQMVKLLKANGFIEVGQPGTSHLKMRNPVTGKQTTVPHAQQRLGQGAGADDTEAGGAEIKAPACIK